MTDGSLAVDDVVRVTGERAREGRLGLHLRRIYRPADDRRVWIRAVGGVDRPDISHITAAGQAVMDAYDHATDIIRTHAGRPELLLKPGHMDNRVHAGGMSGVSIRLHHRLLRLQPRRVSRRALADSQSLTGSIPPAGGAKTSLRPRWNREPSVAYQIRSATCSLEYLNVL